MSDEKKTADLLYGCPSIANYLGLRERQARHLIDRGILSAFRLGGTICVSRSVVDELLAEKQAEAMRAAKRAMAMAK